MDPAKAGGAAVHVNGSAQGAQPRMGVQRVRKLKVEDALTYLDQVKCQFQDRPVVYSDFLDIMKDFKSQAIDTPGVIRRVSRLFRGRPNLIIGFNTFLPQGFVIRVQHDSSILIDHPDGTMQAIDDIEDPTDPQPSQANGRQAASGSPKTRAGSAKEVTPPSASRESVARESSSVPSDKAEMTPAAAPRSASLQETPRNQFDYALVYVNKIKERFANRPEVYQTFLQILQRYQKMPSMGDPNTAVTGEGEVYKHVTKLFENDPDLLQEFSSFLTSQTGGIMSKTVEPLAARSVSPTVKRPAEEEIFEPSASKKAKLESAVNYNSFRSDVVNFVSSEDIVFFDKVENSMSRESFANFLRILALYTKSIISRAELIDQTQRFFNEHSQLKKEFKELLHRTFEKDPKQRAFDALRKRSMPTEEKAIIDYATCKRFGISYRAIPEGRPLAQCTGRSDLCKEVLNDVWVSFPSWSSEDTSNVSSKKTVHEEFIYRTEEERFELDIVIEVNKSAIDLLSHIEMKMKKMKPDDLAKLRFDDRFGGKSSSLMRRAMKRLYGEHANKMLEGLMYSPSIAVPRVLGRMRDKHREWIEAQKQFNRVWREQIEKNYAKSLDHQAASLKSSDMKMLKSKSLIHHIENLYDERMAQLSETNPNGTSDVDGPEMYMVYCKDRNVIYDVNDLLIHHVKRLPNLQKEEKQVVKVHVKKTLLELFGLEAQLLSDDEETTAGEEDIGEKSEEKAKRRPVRKSLAERNKMPKKGKTATKNSKSSKTLKTSKNSHKHRKSVKAAMNAPYKYRLFFGSNVWLMFMRLHHILADRLMVLKRETENMTIEYKDSLRLRAEQERIYKKYGKGVESHETNAADTNRGLLLLKPALQSPKNFYKKVLESVKNLLDGQMESSAFEDCMRSMFETRAYLTFTMDKIVVQMGKYLQQMINDQTNLKCFELYQKMKPTVARNFMDLKRKNKKKKMLSICEKDQKYQSQAEILLRNQNCFKMFYLNAASPVISVEYINTETAESDEEEEDKEQTPTVSGVKSTEQSSEEDKLFVHQYAKEDVVAKFDPVEVGKSVLLRRNITKSKSRPTLKDDKLWADERLQASLKPKIQFVAGTFDLMVRQSARQRASARQHASVVHRNNAFNTTQRLTGFPKSDPKSDQP
ncbi:hypothetical protein QR680_009450 [Steinernema hermaphroditum]|uniref:Histone deacetylase interacting domain-containing protein n=1 Tax=Steinernema hermaphroditum TaxID=289476 RepID=A0AA39IMC8_9BILA|nr:hypothetical protein QR680_009450 [Steinernema hermaphroditum]